MCRRMEVRLSIHGVSPLRFDDSNSTEMSFERGRSDRRGVEDCVIDQERDLLNRSVWKMLIGRDMVRGEAERRDRSEGEGLRHLHSKQQGWLLIVCSVSISRLGFRGEV